MADVRSHVDGTADCGYHGSEKELPEETLILDDRAGLTSSDQLERRFVHRMRNSSISVSQLMLAIPGTRGSQASNIHSHP